MVAFVQIKILFILSTLFSLWVVVTGHSTYVPNSDAVCRTMEPHHKRDAEETPAPFKVVVYSEKVQPGKTISISLIADEVASRRQCRSRWRLLGCGNHKNKKGFRGFYIQARETKENVPIGKFTPREDHTVKVHNCGQGTNNAAFHGVKGQKTNVTLEWTAPDNFTGKVIFTTTFVKKYHKFWTNVTSEPISIRVPYF